MILFELTNTESHPAYQALEIANVNRQYDFLRSIVEASITIGGAFLSAPVIKSLNFHAITCLHTNAGEYRPCQVYVGSHTPVPHHRVEALMDDFINRVNREWSAADPVVLAAYVLWRLNHIHPFINGNGRTARAACYFVICVKLGRWLPGTTILPVLIARDRDDYVDALQQADASAPGSLNLAPLHKLLDDLLTEQLTGVHPDLAGRAARAAQRASIAEAQAQAARAAHAAAMVAAEAAIGTPNESAARQDALRAEVAANEANEVAAYAAARAVTTAAEAAAVPAPQSGEGGQSSPTTH